MKIKANGIKQNYQIIGKGHNLVLIHGAGDNLNMWYHQVPVFSKRFRVITYDVRGFGKTESPEDDYSISTFAEDVFQLLSVLKVENAYFLGYSMGGRIALELTLRHPELVNGLIIANSTGEIMSPSPKMLGSRKLILDALNIGDVKMAASIMTEQAFSPNFKLKNLREFNRYMEIKLQNSSYGLKQVMQPMKKSYSQIDYNQIKCPVLIIAGEHDIIKIEDAESLHRAINGSKLIILPTGHASAIELPEKFNSVVLEFLLDIEKRSIRTD